LGKSERNRKGPVMKGGREKARRKATREAQIWLRNVPQAEISPL